MKIAILGEDIDEIKIIQGHLLNFDEPEIESEVFYTLDDFRDVYQYGTGLNLLIIIIDSFNSLATSVVFSDKVLNFYLKNQNRFFCPVLFVTSDNEMESKLNLESRDGDIVILSSNIEAGLVVEIMERILD